MSEQMIQETVEQPKTTAKKGFATAALVFGILALLTTLLLLNYVFGILALIFGIVYLAKKADVKPKGKAITGIVMAALSLVLSTCLWVGAYIYVTKTDVFTIMEDVASIMGTEIDAKETVSQMISDSTGGAIDLATIEQFVGGEITVERMLNFVGDVNQEEIKAFMEDVQQMDYTAILEDLGGDVSYEILEEKLGKDFSLEDLMDYVYSFINTAQ